MLLHKLTSLNFKQSLKAHPKYPNLKAVPTCRFKRCSMLQTGEQLVLNSDSLFENAVKDGVYLSIEKIKPALCLRFKHETCRVITA